MDSFQAIDRSDSRYAMKQRDIASLITRMGAQTVQAREKWEAQLGDDLVGATEEAVLRGGGDRSILHSGDRFRSNYEKWLRSVK